MKRAIKLVFQLTVTLVIIALLAALLTGGGILFRSLGTRGQFTYMIVLGTVVEGTEPSPMLQDRITAAARYMEKNPDVIAVVTGGKADENNISEAQCMYNGLTELGIAPNRILMEDQATTTAENFQYSVALLEEKLGSCPDHIGVLSSEFHLLRAGLLAKSHGIQASTVPAATSDASTFFTFFLREIVMVWFDGLKVALK
ncbi:MAG: YdcF family protein [Oscillospiraceae bacterium]|nr:YdcF family protein [Oscillospiraceae bacterium]